MRLIDADELKAKACHAKDFAKIDGELMVVGLGYLLDAPTIDPIYAAGGCYCWECLYMTFDKAYNRRWCVRDGCRKVKKDGYGFCDLGKRRGAINGD